VCAQYAGEQAALESVEWMTSL